MDRLSFSQDLVGIVKSANMSFIVLAAISVWFLGALFYGIYNAHLHKLSKFPGPWLFRAYYFPFVYYHSKGTLARKIKKFHEQYGPIVRVSPSELAFSSGEAWNDIYGLLPGRGQNPKDRYCYMPDLGGIFTAGDVEHARHRKLLASSFSNKAIEDQQPMMLRFIDLMVKQLKSKLATGDDVQDISAWYNWTTFDFNGEFTFGESFHCLDKAEWHPWVKALFQGLTVGICLSQLERYRIYTIMRAVLPKSAFKAEVEMKKFTKEHVDSRISRGEMPGRADLFSNILRENKKLDMNWMYDDTTTLVIAGSETTATCCSATTWFLLCNPDKYARVVKEIRDSFKSDDEINMHSVNDLHYLNACLSESLRCFPPVPTGMARRISNKEGQVIAGEFIPPGTAVSVYQLASSRSLLNFARAEEYLPERWLPEGKEEFQNDDQSASQPFSYGPRNCLGKPLAYVEMRIIMAKTLWNFDFELSPGAENWFDQCLPFTVWQKAPLMVKVKNIRE